MANVNRPAMTVPAMEGPEAVRCSFVFLDKPRARNHGDTPKYRMVLMFDKQNPNHVDAVRKIATDLDSIAKEAFPGVPMRIVANEPNTGPRCPIKDGDIAVDQQGQLLKNVNPEFAGHYVVTVTSSDPVAVCGPNKEMIQPSMCKSGYWYKVNLNCYSYTTGNNGVSVGLNGAQFIREDTVLGGSGPSLDQMFGAVGGDPSMYQGGGGQVQNQGQQQTMNPGQGHGGTEAWLNGSPGGQPQGGGDLLGGGGQVQTQQQQTAGSLI